MSLPRQRSQPHISIVRASLSTCLSLNLPLQELTVNRFNSNATNIKGTATNLQSALSELEAELKIELAGQKEYEQHEQKLRRKIVGATVRVSM